MPHAINKAVLNVLDLSVQFVILVFDKGQVVVLLAKITVYNAMRLAVSYVKRIIK